MPEQEPTFLAQLAEQDRIHFRNLVLIRPQLPSEGQLRLIEGLAHSLAAPRLLTLIARTPHWLLHGPILNALAQNEATPEPIRRDLEMAVSLFDLMREADRAPVAYRQECAESAKALYQQLPAGLKPIVKQQLKQLAKPVNTTGATQELPPLPKEDQDWDALTQPPSSDRGLIPAPPLPSFAEQLARAEGTMDPEELTSFLQKKEEALYQAALRNPLVTDELLCAVLPRLASPAMIEEIYGEARWYFRENIRQAIYDSPACPESLAKSILRTRELISLLGKPKGQSSLQRTVALFHQIEESDYQFITYWIKRNAPALLRVIKIFYDRMQRRRDHAVSGLEPATTEGKWASLEERVFLANQATQPDQLITSLRDPDPQVFQIVLENPGLTPREVLAAIPSLDASRIASLAAHRSWSVQPGVTEALLHSIHISARTALQLLRNVQKPRVLLEILRDSRIPHMELKQEAMESLKRLYLGMNQEDRIITLRTLGELIRQLPQEVLRDEEALLLVVADRQLDPNILLRLARNKQTPRSVLERIASHPILMAHPAIMSELLLNPKTPREAAIRIWGLLSESEQRVLLASPHLPSTLRVLGA